MYETARLIFLSVYFPVALRLSQQGGSLRSLASPATRYRKSLFLLGNISGGGKVVFVARRQIAPRWTSIYWSPSFNILRHAVTRPSSLSASQHFNSSIPLLRDCRISNPPVLRVEPKSQVSERTGTNISQRFPPTKSHTILRTTNNESDWLLQSAEFRCYSGEGLKKLV